MKKIKDMTSSDIYNAVSNKFINEYCYNLSLEYCDTRIVSIIKKRQKINVNEYVFTFTPLNYPSRQVHVKYYPHSNELKATICESLLGEFSFNDRITPIFEQVKRIKEEYNLPENFFKVENNFPRSYHLSISEFLPNTFSDGSPTSEVSYIKFDLNINADGYFHSFYIKEYLKTSHLHQISSEVSYYVNSFRKEKHTGRQVLSPKAKKFINEDYFNVLESFIYDNYLKDKYEIKRKNKKELDLIKMIRC